MDSPVQTKRNKALRSVGGILGLAGVIALALWVVNESRIAGLRAAVRSTDPQTRAKAMAYICDVRERRAFDAVVKQLEQESDREILEQAGCAIMRMGDLRGLEPLRRRATAGPDDWVRAKLIIYTARLPKEDPSLTSWLETGLNSGGQWARVASAIGLLELGRPEAGQALIEWLPGLEPEVRKFALAEFRKRIGEPMTQAVGWPIDWDGLPEAAPTDPRWAQLRDFWQTRASPRLLNDVLARQDRQDPDWTLLRRLLHARDRAERLLF